ncbi:MAG: hypothetical protein QXP31_04755 [Pyrobaculum sp.]
MMQQGDALDRFARWVVATAAGGVDEKKSLMLAAKTYILLVAIGVASLLAYLAESGEGGLLGAVLTAASALVGAVNISAFRVAYLYLSEKSPRFSSPARWAKIALALYPLALLVGAASALGELYALFLLPAAAVVLIIALVAYIYVYIVGFFALHHHYGAPNFQTAAVLNILFFLVIPALAAPIFFYKGAVEATQKAEATVQ